MSHKFAWAFSITLVLAPDSVFAEGAAYGVSEDMEVAVEKANLLAGKEAERRNTCMAKRNGFANPAECTKVDSGRLWSCVARYSLHRGSCRAAPTFTDAIRDASDALDKLCSNGREAACAAAAGG